MTIQEISQQKAVFIAALGFKRNACYTVFRDAISAVDSCSTDHQVRGIEGFTLLQSVIRRSGVRNVQRLLQTGALVLSRAMVGRVPRTAIPPGAPASVRR